ncbi:SRPBCC family protein [Nocardia camponoti]|uniref:Activator of Hsp90 ATPase homologue 1/2-like C-terminal domain-containing protein n=1 Tax=Nocardia camponoti TaxID=1616106 RepID=A0A917QH07_9NOCA|nr:SRPBCC family protein [Nocardia camponoti]GGK50158.1 hypothetical protein GCM10011591_22120 [Nocardia camponoti]
MSTATTDVVVTPVSDREIHMERDFDAPVAKVWDAFSRIEKLSRWWGRGHTLDVERWEFRKGGHWRFVERVGDEAWGFEGRFAEITPEKRIVQTFEYDGAPGHVSVDTTTFVDLGDGRTRVLTDTSFHTPEDCKAMVDAGMATGLSEGYRVLDGILAEKN